MSSLTLRFSFDFVSPYAYLGWTQIHALAARHDCVVEPVPILFAALLNHYGHKGPAEIPPKRLYIFKNVLRLAHRLGVPLVPPPAHPFNPLLSLRLASLPLPAAVRVRLIDALFAGAWAGGGGVAEPDGVRRLLQGAGLDAATLLAEAETAAAKDRLRQQTDDALARGVFGVPSVEVDGELFWGCDAFPDLEAFLRGEDPVRPADLARWSDLPAGAQRKR